MLQSPMTLNELIVVVLTNVLAFFFGRKVRKGSK